MPLSPSRSNIRPSVSVLVVDDDLMVGRSLCRALVALDPRLKVALATSGEAALSVIRAAPPDVVVTDFDMGRVSGQQLLEILQRDYPTVVRIAHSSQKEPASRSDLRHLVHATLNKPIHPAELTTVIASELAKRRS